MFDPKRAGAAMPAQDLERAKSFYADKLGLKPIEEFESGEARYEVGGSTFYLFVSAGKPSGDHTQLGFDVADVDEAVRALQENGVVFEEYDQPGFKTVNGVASVEGWKGAWFKDSEGNLIALAEEPT